MKNTQQNEAKIYIMTSDPFSDGRCKLMLNLNYNGIKFRYYTGEACLPEHFDKAKQRVNRKHPFNLEANAILNKLCTDVVGEYKRFKLQGIIPTKEQLKFAITPKKVEEIVKYDMGYYFDLLERRQIVDGKEKATRENYKTLRRRLSLYERTRKIKLTFQGFDSIRHTDFMEFLIYEKNNHPNTIAKRNQCLKHFFDFCLEEHNVDVNLFYKKIKIVTVETNTIFLEEKEVEILENLNVDSFLEKTRDCYLFACYTGRRYSEVAKFTYDQLSINDKGLEVMTFYEDKKIRKGNLVVALNDKALNIINKYRESEVVSKKKRFVLPTMTNQRLNKYLKELGHLAGIDTQVEKIIYVHGVPQRVIVPKYELMDFHSARHTYATLSIQRGMQIEILQKELNHSKITQTMHYAKIVKSYQHKEALKIWNVDKITETKNYISNPSQELERIKEKIMVAEKKKIKSLELEYELDKMIVNDLIKKGFVIKVPSAIEKLSGIYHIISWE